MDTQLQPSSDLRRPDAHGQLPHIFTTLTPSKPLAKLELGDIVEINWTGVETAIRDAIIRVRHEGDLSSATLRDVLRLSSLALRKIDLDDAQVARTYEAHPGIGFLGWLFSFLPTAAGASLRHIRLERKQQRRTRRTYAEWRERLFSLRKELAEEVDDAIETLLIATSPEYSDWHAAIAPLEPVRTIAQSFLKELRLRARYERESDWIMESEYKAHRRQIEKKWYAMVSFCERNLRNLGSAMSCNPNFAELEVCLFEIVQQYDAKMAVYEQPMIAAREAKKRELYGDADI